MLILTLFHHERPVGAEDINQFEMQMSNWNKKITLASKYLREAEAALKIGDKNIGCINQKKAGKLGVEASESLIKAWVDIAFCFLMM